MTHDDTSRAVPTAPGEHPPVNLGHARRDQAVRHRASSDARAQGDHDVEGGEPPAAGRQLPGRPADLLPLAPPLVLSMARTSARALGTPVEVWSFPGSPVTGGRSGWESAPAGQGVDWLGAVLVAVLDPEGDPAADVVAADGA